MLKKPRSLSAILLTIFSLTGCSTLKIVHVPVGCEGQPNVSINFDDKEAETITDDMLLKLTIFATTLRERINSQCEINKEHDRLHEG